MEATASCKHHRINALASEVARHQLVRKFAALSFNSPPPPPFLHGILSPSRVIGWRHLLTNLGDERREQLAVRCGPEGIVRREPSLNLLSTYIITHI